MIRVYKNNNMTNDRHNYIYYVEILSSDCLLYKTDYVIDILTLANNSYRFNSGKMLGKFDNNIRLIYTCEKLEDLNNIVNEIPEEFI